VPPWTRRALKRAPGAHPGQTELAASGHVDIDRQLVRNPELLDEDNESPSKVLDSGLYGLPLAIGADPGTQPPTGRLGDISTSWFWMRPRAYSGSRTDGRDNRVIFLCRPVGEDRGRLSELVPELQEFAPAHWDGGHAVTCSQYPAGDGGIGVGVVANPHDVDEHLE
jgi:hypothetical protein